MKNKIQNLAAAAFFITTMGYLLDSDPVEPSVKMRFIEFFVTTAIIFSIITTFYWSASFLIKRLKQH